MINQQGYDQLQNPRGGQGNPSGNQYQQMRYRRLARGAGGQPSIAPGNPGGQIVRPGGINPGLPQPFPANPFPGMGGGGGGQGQINGPGGIQGPNPGLPKPFPSAPPPGFSYPGGMGQGQPQQYQQPSQINPGQGYGPQTGLQQRFGQQQGYPTSAATSNPYMQQFRQPPQQPQQMPANPYNPYQNDWNWNQSGPFPGNRFPAY